MRDLHVKYQDFDANENAPILHRKETLVTPDYPLYDRFANLTKQEEDWGLLDKKHGIRKKRGWLKCLDDHCAALQGHRVVWRKDADPYKSKLLRSQIRSQQKQDRNSVDSLTDH